MSVHSIEEEETKETNIDLIDEEDEGFYVDPVANTTPKVFYF